LAEFVREPARTTTYCYDAFNRLTEVLDGAGAVIARYTF
jgi:YD repeat-containing protein